MAGAADSKDPDVVEFQHGLPLFDNDLLKLKVDAFRCVGAKSVTAVVFVNCTRETAVYSSTAMSLVDVALVREPPLQTGDLERIGTTYTIQINVYHKGSADLHHLHVQGLMYDWVLLKSGAPIRTNYIDALKGDGEYVDWMQHAKLSITPRTTPAFGVPVYITHSMRNATAASSAATSAEYAAAAAKK